MARSTERNQPVGFGGVVRRVTLQGNNLLGRVGVLPQAHTALHVPGHFVTHMAITIAQRLTRQCMATTTRGVNNCPASSLR
jgi:hypothetical protein